MGKRSFLANLRRHPQRAFWCLIGALIGALFSSLPLFPYKLPDSAATIFGAAVGAFIAVASAAWVAQRKDWQHRFRLNAALGIPASNVSERGAVCLEVLRELRGRSTPLSSLQVAKFTHLEDACVQALSDLSELKPAFTHNPGDLLSFVQVKKAVEAVLLSSMGIRENDGKLAEIRKHIDRRAENPDASHPPMPPIAFSHSPDELDNRLWKLQAALNRVGEW